MDFLKLPFVIEPERISKVKKPSHSLQPADTGIDLPAMTRAPFKAKTRRVLLPRTSCAIFHV